MRTFSIFKRCFDFVASLLLLIVISPLFFILMIFVRIKLGSPVFFCQVRAGKDKVPFRLIKFRTMTNACDKNGDLLPDSQRFTSFGHWLRSSSLDELPELINIIKGDMSVIGPRPMPVTYNDYYTKREQKRFDVKGGLVPPESVDKDPFISWDKQFEYDVAYVEHYSLKTDIKILYLVFRQLFNRFEGDLGGWARQPLNVERSKIDNNE